MLQLDALIPAVEALANDGSLTSVAKAARQGADSTIGEISCVS